MTDNLATFRMMLAGLMAMATTVALSQPDEADDSSVLTAELMPRADQSLLLDVTEGSQGRIAIGERGHVLIADSSGNWVQVEGVPTRSALTALSAVGDNVWAVGHDAVIIHSGDGGRTWELQQAEPDLEQPLLDVLFLSSREGWAIGAYGYVVRTTDGGRNWYEHALNDEDDYHLNAMVELASGRLFIAAEGGNAYFSDDRGETWDWVELPYSGSMFGALAMPDGRLMTFGLRGNLFVSSDGGETFGEIPTPSENSLFGGAPIGDSSLVLVGANGEVLYQHDPEAPVRTLSHPEGNDFSAVLAVDRTSYILVGEGGVQSYSPASN